MSTTIASNGLVDWEIFVTGDGVASLNAENTLLDCEAGLGTGRAYARKRIPARPGETVTLTYNAELISGTCSGVIDSPASGSSQNTNEITSTNMVEYSVSYTVPFTALETDYVQFVIGILLNDAGRCLIANPSISVDNSHTGFKRIWCSGLIALEKSGGVTTPSLNLGFHNCGIVAMEYDQPNKKLLITTQKSINQSLGLRPIPTAEITNDILPNVSVKAGRYSPNTGVFEVQFIDAVNPTVFSDINNILVDGQIIYVSVEAGGI